MTACRQDVGGLEIRTGAEMLDSEPTFLGQIRIPGHAEGLSMLRKIIYESHECKASLTPW